MRNGQFMSSYLEIPVIIPSYEPDEKLIALLHALQAAGIRHVIVVDDGSGRKYAHFFEQAAMVGPLPPVDCSEGSWRETTLS